MINTAQDLYAVLGVASDATPDDIRGAYRVAARRFHPDVNPNEGAALQFRDIISAYEVLSDPNARQNYDDLRARLAPEPPLLTMQVTPSKRVVPVLGEPQVVYVMLEIGPNRDQLSQDSSKRTTPVNLALVLDHSTSMKDDGRLDRLKKAAREVIEHLSERDLLTVVSFSDRAKVLVDGQPVTHSAKEDFIAQVNNMSASGGTEIFQGLYEAYKVVAQRSTNAFVNHIILVTDGHTYDAANLSLNLADEAATEGIGISAMGIGDEWNDDFLDDLVSRTGGTSAYINSAGAVARFLNDRVRSLGAAYAERLTLSIAPDSDVRLESVFKLNPYPQPVPIERQPLQLGTLEVLRPLTLLLQLQMADKLKESFRGLVRLDLTADIISQQRMGYQVLSDLSIEVARDPQPEHPPRNILDALGKLTLYRMQQKAEASLRAGRVEEATRRLENLATRLLAVGQNELARTAMEEVRRVKATRTLSENGRKTIKFGTRMLLTDNNTNKD